MDKQAIIAAATTLGIMEQKKFRVEDANFNASRVTIECPECAFEFWIEHDLDGEKGVYTCPLCEEERLKEENKRLREALEFYADEANYAVKTVQCWEGTLLIDDSIANEDEGEIAREALQK